MYNKNIKARQSNIIQIFLKILNPDKEKKIYYNNIKNFFFFFCKLFIFVWEYILY